MSQFHAESNFGCKLVIGLDFTIWQTQSFNAHMSLNFAYLQSLPAKINDDNSTNSLLYNQVSNYENLSEVQMQMKHTQPIEFTKQKPQTFHS